MSYSAWHFEQKANELEKKLDAAESERDLLRALLWAASRPRNGTERRMWRLYLEHHDGWRLYHYCHAEGANVDVSVGGTGELDLSAIPAPVAARLVADWREATG